MGKKQEHSFTHEKAKISITASRIAGCLAGVCYAGRDLLLSPGRYKDIRSWSTPAAELHVAIGATSLLDGRPGCYGDAACLPGSWRQSSLLYATADTKCL